MNLEINKIYHGFKALQEGFVSEVHSRAYLMEHVQSGARLLYLANDDDNKVFSIAFRTPPADDTGVAHILEHSSLCGSRKYHLKEPFVDLVKGSLNTFLNAMTYPDKTVYPVASRNAKDFHNLMDVYLDAVFYPLLYENKYTLRQEGWHYNLESPEDELSYNGVVYNEMKGVYSSPDAFLENEAMKALFPDTCYRFESGGYPDAIPQLTQEQFENFHKTYYSPENSFIYLYGDMDIAATLAYLDAEYLSQFSKTGQVQSEIPLQAPLARTAEVEAFYPVDAEEDCKGKTYHELSIVTGKAVDLQTSMSLRLLEAVLLESESSPLRRALLAAGVGQNISGSYTGSLQQPVFAIRAAGSEKDLRDKFISVIYKTLQDLTINGIDKQLLEASLNSTEFKLREADFGPYPKGLIYGLGVLDTWLYGGDPIEGLRYEQALAAMRKGLASNYYESLIENYLLDNTHKVIVTLLPQPGKEEADQAAAAEKMQRLKDGMTQEELAQYAFECAELHRLQAEPDSEESRASIPILQRSDIRRRTERIAKVEEGEANRRLVFVPAVTNKIAYTNWYFDISGVPAEQLPLCFLLSDVLGKFNTRRYSYQELSTYGIMYTGGITFNVRAVSEAENADAYRLYFSVKAKALLQNLPHVFDLLQAIGTESLLNDVQRFQELLAEIKTDWDDEFFNRGQTIAISRLYSYCAAGARANEQDQFSYYQFLKKLSDNFAEQGAAVLQQLQDLLALFFQKSRFTLFYSCDAEDKEQVKAQCLDFAAKLPEATVAVAPEILPAPGHNEGITTAGKVQYVAAGGSFAKFGHKYTGAMRVLETILRYEYLWTKIRIQGGAYGATARFELNGLGVFASYRDPQLAKSLEAYKALPAWLQTVEFPDRELDKYVIGTISGMDTPLTNSMRLDQAALQYLKQIPEELRQRIRDEVLDVSNADLQALGKVVEDMLSDGLLCVVGGKQPIEANKDKFTAIINS
ncbi:MAG: insulinase family protein [Phascolarctobacterium sp.]|uniref:insulinase family protein n=1 Tax=Phascolarctobacterium sp. TaxID=2049039 RepID=UPI0026DCF8F3|nr:insulinase family protein [Phascolarctobacterium sp.]MDO4921488.1 insulinase family protein [Phascolarctobacterium sp.]